MRQNPRHLERGWKSFEHAAIRPDASSTQRRAMRDAYYAGAMITFRTLTAEVSAGTDEPTPEDLCLMADIDAEIAEFGRELDTRYGGAKATQS
jgi:hypothetical protein